RDLAAVVRLPGTDHLHLLHHRHGPLRRPRAHLLPDPAVGTCTSIGTAGGTPSALGPARLGTAGGPSADRRAHPRRGRASLRLLLAGLHRRGHPVLGLEQPNVEHHLALTRISPSGDACSPAREFMLASIAWRLSPSCTIMPPARRSSRRLPGLGRARRHHVSSRVTSLSEQLIKKHPDDLNEK